MVVIALGWAAVVACWQSGAWRGRSSPREASPRRARRRPHRAVAAGIVIAVVAIAAGGCMMDMEGMHSGADNSRDPAVSGGSETMVRIEDFAFEPGNLEVPAGARVTWLNGDAAKHDATARDGSWRTERLSRGERAMLTFETPGTYLYVCSIHPGMKARLTVR